MPKPLTAQSVERMKMDPTKRLEIPDGVLPGLYLVVQPSGVKSFAVRYRHAGRPRKLTLGPYPALDLAAARTVAREALRAAAEGRDPGAEKAERTRTTRDNPKAGTIEGLVDTFLDKHVRMNNRPRTADAAEGILRGRIVPLWGSRKIEAITASDVAEFLDGLMTRGHASAANRALAVIRKMFGWAVERGLLTVSPCDRIKAPAVLRSRDRVLSDDELRLVWRAAETMGHPFGSLVQLLILTLQRRDEVARATRAELHQDGALWTIPASRTKNGLIHDVPLPPEAQTTIAGLPRIKGKAGRPSYLLTTSGDAPASNYAKNKARLDEVMLDLARKEAAERGRDPAEVEIAPWRLHDLRRTGATGMARLGIPVHVIEAVLNHKSGTIAGVAAVYNRHSYLEEKRSALGMWSGHVLSLLNEEEAASV